MTIPDELAEAARMDGSGPIRFFVEMLLPLSRTNMAALTVEYVVRIGLMYMALRVIDAGANYYMAAQGQPLA